MSTNKTKNYQLHLWEPGDDFLREEFNENNAKVDAALKAQAEELGAAVSELSAELNTTVADVRAEFGESLAQMNTTLGEKSRFSMGTYTGTGTYGAASPNTLTFDFTPKLVFVRAQLTSESSAGDCKFCSFCAKQGENLILAVCSTTASEWSAGSSLMPVCLTANWSGNTVSWYHTSYAGKQGNYKGITYLYWAIG